METVPCGGQSAQVSPRQTHVYIYIYIYIYWNQNNETKTNGAALPRSIFSAFFNTWQFYSRDHWLRCPWALPLQCPLESNSLFKLTCTRMRRLLVTIPFFRPFAQRIRMVHMCKAAALQAVLSLKPADLWASKPPWTIHKQSIETKYTQKIHACYIYTHTHTHTHYHTQLLRMSLVETVHVPTAGS